MNDNATLDEADYPEWVYGILNKHSCLADTDGPPSAYSALMNEAAIELEGLKVEHHVRGMTSDIIKRTEAALELIADARRLAPLCMQEPWGSPDHR